MFRYTLTPLLAFALILCACDRTVDQNLPKAPKPVFPTVGESVIATVGGHAQAYAGRAAGNSGDVSISVNGGNLIADDGREAVAPTDNFLTAAVLEDRVVTWAELIGLQAPGIVGGVATFNLVGLGLEVPRRARIDLSDAPTTGTPVDHVVFSADQEIFIRGDIVTARDGAPAVGVTLRAQDDIAILGVVSTSGLPGEAAGDIEVDSLLGSVLLRGRLLALGGPGSTAFDGADGGNVSVTAGAGDVVLDPQPIRLHGHPGALSGGNGGAFTYSGFGDTDIHWVWDVLAQGGPSSVGTGGAAGDAMIQSEADIHWYCTIRLDGGDSTSGTGANGGSLQATTTGEMTGLLLTRTRGGNGADVGGNGGDVLLSADAMYAFELDQYTPGGSAPQGGNGGDTVLEAAADISDLLLTVVARGAHGSADGGHGGTLVIDAQDGPAVWLDVWFFAEGGNTNAGDGGNGGEFTVLANGDIGLDVLAHIFGGRGGATGGQGGYAQFNARAVPADPGGHASLTGSIHGAGGRGDFGGQGAIVDAVGGDGVTAQGLSLWLGGGEGNDTGGEGGWFEVSALIADHVGEINVTGGVVNVSGGNGGVLGGLGGVVFFETPGDAVFIQTSIHAHGGSGESGGDGGTVFIETDADGVGPAGNVTIAQSAVVNIAGGHAEGGSGGNGGVLVIDASAADIIGPGGSVFVRGMVNASGGNGGGEGGIVYAVTNGAQITAQRTIDVRGGIDGDGGSIQLGLEPDSAPDEVRVKSTARLLADGRGTGLAGTIALDPKGSGPNNPALIIEAGAILSTNDGNGTDQSATNIQLD